MTLTRDIDLLQTLQQVVPDPLLAAFILITQLGSVPVLLGLAAGLYWFYDRRIGAITIAAIIGAGALTTGLKAFFGLPRPPSSYHMIPADGYGFPSGHAIAATITWGTVATHLSYSTRHRRAAVALVVIGLVSLSRLILGVHYAIDVAAGMLAGLTYLALVAIGPQDSPKWPLRLALVTSVLALMLARTPDSVLYATVAAASLVTWQTGAIPNEPWDTGALRITLLGGLLLGGAGVGYLLSPSIPLALFSGSVIGAGLIGLPGFWARYQSG